MSDKPLSLIDASEKLRAVINKLRGIRRRQEKALIFAWFRDAQEILRRVIESEFKMEVHILNGQTRGTGSRMLAARTHMIREFEEKTGFNVLILSPEVAGVGLTIVKANHVLHYGRWWNPAVEDQATDRVYRIGQERDVEVYYFIATDSLGRFKTFDEHLHSLISRKRRSAENFVVGINAAEVIFVQCKHAQDGRSFDPNAIDEVTGGETYYTCNLLPSGLRGRRPRLAVAANGEADSRTHRDAEQRGVHLITGRFLLKRLASTRVTRPMLDRVEGQRVHTIEAVKRRLQDVAEQTSL